MDLPEKRLEVARALRALESIIQQLVQSLAHSGVTPILAAAGASAPLRQVSEAYSAIDYAINDETNASIVCLGTLGVGAEILKTAMAVNDAKLKFKALCAPLSRLQTRVPTHQDASTTPITAMRAILRSIQRSDLNLLAAYRKIPVVTIPPASIVYSRATTRSVYRKTVAEIHTLLSTATGTKASADRARLEAMDPRETYLAYVRGRPRENVRANIVYTRLDARGRGRVQIAAELPILYPKSRREPPLVRFAMPSNESNDTTRGPRRTKLESIPLLESLPVYRYR
jgi:hypothetical protein